MNKLVEITNLSAGYENKKVLKHVSLSVWEKDFLGIIGPNGGGKTTLVKVMMRLLKPMEGSFSFYKNGVKTSSLNIGYMPQINKLDDKFPISAREVIASGISHSGSWLGVLSRFQKEKVEAIAEQMRVSDFLDRPIGQLSGGQLQRILLGRSMVDDPDLLILDEPNSYVDKRFESDFYKILQELNVKTTIVLVLHDIGTVLSLVKNIACVNEDVHYHAGTDVSQAWLEKAYGYPLELVAHRGANAPIKRLLHSHEECDCCKSPTKPLSPTKPPQGEA